MKTLNNGLTLICSGLLLVLTGCATAPEPPLDPQQEPTINLTNTRWHYVDSELGYNIEFLPDGMIRTEHPRENTPNDDNWEQSGKMVNIYMNNRYSVLRGQLSDNRQMSGTANNQKGDTWKWTAERLD